MAAGIIGYGLWHFGQELPDYKYLKAYEPPVVSRVFAGNGQLMAEYAIEKRVFVPITAIPKIVKNAFIAAEDQRFYDHTGLDFIGLARAIITNIIRYSRGQRLIGASTITQQVTKNFLLSNDYSLSRKIKEAILAFRIEQALSKDRILELYLNQIYLGYQSYGVAQAALAYFNKSLHDLSISEAAFLAALPKAPNNYNPKRKHKAALARRNWVIERLYQEKFINRDIAENAKKTPLVTYDRQKTTLFKAGYYIEGVRQELVKKYSLDKVLQQGLSIHVNLDPMMQQYAEKSLQSGLRAYDRRHGYRGAINHIDVTNLQPYIYIQKLQEIPKVSGMLQHWQMGLITHITKDKAEIILQDLSLGFIDLESTQWARKVLKNGKVGQKITHLNQVFTIGDVILVSASNDDKISDDINFYQLEQIPEIEGALIAMNPHNGKIYAMSGGWSFDKSKFNRAVQAYRQPGSALKPIIYLAALTEKNKNYHPATLLLDAPIVIDQGPGLPKWKPANYSKKYYGETPMRIGIEKSRNLMTIRLALDIGIEKIKSFTEKLKIYDDLPLQYSMALGAGETNLIRITRAYATIVNGGKDIVPSFIDRVSDRYAKNLLKHDGRHCPQCSTNDAQTPPILPDVREQLFDSRSAFQVTSMLEGVVKRGTGKKIRSVGVPLAGKTGTTNDSYDAWFVGFSPDLAVGVYTGFDKPRSLGYQRNGVAETGSTVAAPIFKEFMQYVLGHKNPIPFRTPSGISMVKINPKTGHIVTDSSQKYIHEYLKTEQLKLLTTQAYYKDQKQLDGIY